MVKAARGLKLFRYQRVAANSILRTGGGVFLDTPQVACYKHRWSSHDHAAALVGPGASPPGCPRGAHRKGSASSNSLPRP